jgi:hypothetical protein
LWFKKKVLQNPPTRPPFFQEKSSFFEPAYPFFL